MPYNLFIPSCQITFSKLNTLVPIFSTDKNKIFCWLDGTWGINHTDLVKNLCQLYNLELANMKRLWIEKLCHHFSRFAVKSVSLICWFIMRWLIFSGFLTWEFNTGQTMKFFVKDLLIYSANVVKSLMENFISCAV